MERLLTNDLFLWKNKRNRRPLIITGSHQVGKTWLLKDFSESYFEDSLYIDLKKNYKVKSLFDDTISPRRSIEILGALFGKVIEPYKTLLILDSIERIPSFEKVLKKFYDDASQYLICCSTTYQNINNDSGCFHILNLYPLNFEEFLLANGEDDLVDFFKSGALAYLPKLLENKLIDYLKLYFIIGGMPASVNSWVQSKDLSDVECTLNDILNQFVSDFETLTDNKLKSKINYVWRSLPKQLSKENRKFMYSTVRPGGRAREYEEGLEWLLNHSYATPIWARKDTTTANDCKVDLKSFRVFLPDIGLLRMIYQIQPSLIESQNKIFQDHNYSLTLQFVFQELVTKLPIENINYWSSGATAEIDFLFQYNQIIYPLEINVYDNLKARSTRIYEERFHPQRVLRVSLSPLRIKNSFVNIPLHLLFNLENYFLNLL
ncbi:ATP-binding protein [Anaerosacchariphilus polymeriproducens]|uniref:ATP-binding protein n=1 Tax=Anaerosacchariphilus polymeriproducens TaxID=1812858 RepID=UPI00138FBAEB|nr:AAA family ATPase [Anaerosacchariphilus polymeriproducens]